MISLCYAGRIEEANAELDRALVFVQQHRAANPHDRRIPKADCLAQGARGNRAAAISVCREAAAIDPHDAIDRLDLGLDVATGLALAGADDEALDVIERWSRREVAEPAATFELSPAFRHLAGNPRFKAAMAGLGEPKPR